VSHFDDIDFISWIDAPGTIIGGILFLAVAVAAIAWAVTQDSSALDLCHQHGEKFVDARHGYTLCEADGGVVVRRYSEKTK
jgi:hypothetical protein